jgi:hypothetical protein
LNLWKPTLDQINAWRQRAFLQITTQEEFDQTMVTFLPHYAPQIRSGRLTENQVFSKYINWIKRDNSKDKAPTGRNKSEKPNSTKQVNAAWENQPNTDDRPFHGTVEIPEDFQ